MYGCCRNQRFSPLAQVTRENVEALRPAWAFSSGGQFAGLEATPLMRAAVLYVSTGHAPVFALESAVPGPEVAPSGGMIPVPIEGALPAGRQQAGG